jgi:uncharacterized membrane protein
LEVDIGQTKPAGRIERQDRAAGSSGTYGGLRMSSARPSAATAALVLILGGAGIAHFARPEFFDPLVPTWMPGSARLITHLSGAVEIAAAVLLAVPRTRHFGGWFAFATFLAVYPANIQAALDGGMKDMDPPFDSALAAWLRLPFQLPLLWLAWRVAHERRPGT